MSDPGSSQLSLLLPTEPLGPAVLPINKTHDAISMFAVREGYADHFVCKRGGLRPPQPPGVLKPSMLAMERKHRVITMFAVREVVQIILFANGGAAPLSNPPAV